MAYDGHQMQLTCWFSPISITATNFIKFGSSSFDECAIIVIGEGLWTILWLCARMNVLTNWMEFVLNEIIFDNCFFETFSDFNLFGIVRWVFVGVKFAENAPQRITLALLWRLWHARLATSVPPRSGQWLRQPTHIYVETNHAVVCT